MQQKIRIPDGAQLTIKGMEVTARGPKGELKRDFDDPRFTGSIEFAVSGDEFIVKTESKKKRMRAMVGTYKGHVKNMCIGVTKGYRYTLKIVYTHFPITVSVKGKEVEVKNFLSEKGLRKARIMGDSEVKADKEFITVSGINLEDVSQTSANIERSCKITRRDKRIFIDGIYPSERALGTGEKMR